MSQFLLSKYDNSSIQALSFDQQSALIWISEDWIRNLKNQWHKKIKVKWTWNKMNKYKNDNLQGSFWQEVESMHARKDGLPGTKKSSKFFTTSTETSGSFFSQKPVEAHISAKTSGWTAQDVSFS